MGVIAADRAALGVEFREEECGLRGGGLGVPPGGASLGGVSRGSVSLRGALPAHLAEIAAEAEEHYRRLAAFRL